MTEGHDRLLAFQDRRTVLRRDLDPGQPSVRLLKTGQLRAEVNLAAKRKDFGADILHHADQNVRSNVRLGVVGDALVRTGLRKLTQDPALSLVFRTGIQLPVGEGTGAALAKLDVALGIQNSGLPKPFHRRAPGLCVLTAFDHDRFAAGHCQSQSSKHPAGAEADHDGPLFRQRFRLRDPVIERLCRAHAGISALSEHLVFAVPGRDVHRVEPADVLLFPCVQGPAPDFQTRDLRGLDSECVRGKYDQTVWIVPRRNGYISYRQHFVRNSPANCPDDQAHCRLYPPQSPSTSKTSPAA